MTPPDWWENYSRLKPKIREALGDEGYDFDWLDPRLLNGRAQIWLGERSALITEVDAWTIAAAGDQQELIGTLRPQAEEWGRRVGLSQVIIEGRKGWQRRLEPLGYLPINGRLRKELT